MLKNTQTITKHIPIQNDLDVIVARLRVREVAREIGFGTIDQARISLAASELARILTQILGQQGELVVSNIQANGHLGIEVTSVAHPRATTDIKPPDDKYCFSNVIALVDDGCVDTDQNQTTRVTLMKWLA